MDRAGAGVLDRAVRRLAAGAAPDDTALLRRYLTAGDAAAFAALVERHGGLVLGVCRAVLGHRQDAEDVCQATFLTLARKAASVRRPGSLGCWLHGVALRLARKARTRDDRRRDRERAATANHPTANAADDLTWRELRDVLHEELARLPEPLRAPVLLCYWQGLSHGEAARRLGWRLYTFKDRLQRARARLAARLARRGLAPAALPLLLLSAAAANARPPAALVAAIVRTAHAPAGGPPAALLTPRRAAALAVTLAAGLIAAGAGRGPEPPAPAAPAPPADATPADLAGDPLPAGASARLGTVRFRHGNTVYGLSLARDGRTVATVGGQPTAHLWDADTGRERWQAFVEGSPCVVAHAPDGRAVATGGDAGVALWDADSGRPLWSVRPGRVNGLGFSPDGRLLAVGRSQSGLMLLDPATGAVIADLTSQAPPDHGETTRMVAFTPDGRLIAPAGNDVVRIWDVAGRKVVRELRGHRGAARAAAFSPDGKTLATGGIDKTVRLWDTETGREQRVLTGHADVVTAAAFSPDGRLLATSSAGAGGPRERAALRLWDPATGAELAQLGDHAEGCRGVAFSPDGATVFAACGGSVRRWDVAARRELSGPAGHFHWVGPVAVRPDGRAVATGGGDGTVRLWDPATGRELRRFVLGEEPVDGLAFSPDGRRLAAGSRRGVVYLGDPDDPAGLRRLGTHRNQAVVAFTPDGRSLVSTASNSQITVWDVATGRAIRSRTIEGLLHPHSLAVSPDGRLLAVGGRLPSLHKIKGFVGLWDLATLQELRHWDGEQEPRNWAGEFTYVRALAFTPDGRWLASGSFDDQTRLWDVATGKELARFRGGQRVAVSADGRALATTEFGGSAHVYELASRGERWARRGHAAAAHGVAFAPDGRSLVTGSMDATALVWDLCRAADAPAHADGLWAALADPDAARAFAAVAALAGRPGLAEGVLRGRLRPAAFDRAPLDRLIADLAGEKLADREQAAAALEKLGDLAEPVLREALARGPTLEARRRIERILAQLTGPVTNLEVLRSLRAVEALELAGTPGARALLAELAGGASGARLTQEAKAALARRGGPRIPPG
jgi:RNA polymerase sigma factor (sigma-70 family)